MSGDEENLTLIEELKMWLYSSCGPSEYSSTANDGYGDAVQDIRNIVERHSE